MTANEAAIEIMELNKAGLTDKKPLITVDKKPSITVDKIIEFLMQNKEINNRQAREITGLSSTRVREIFKDMSDKNIIVAHGSNRDRNYTLK
ncbi:MAG: winged helix-turn-helix domain-containing protein [Ruminiclostridium sp.]|nr:winged helix-turn-helix domain-containing protein [Ruminiclostridium sp.]